MIYSKVVILDGVYKVTLFDSIGNDVTKDNLVTSIFHRELSKNNFEEIFKTEATEGVISRDILEERESIFVTLLINGTLYKKNIKIKIINRTSYQSYTILYKTTSSLVQLSNIMSSRFSYFMPKWSTAYKNQITNFSKTSYPLFSNIEKSFTKTLETNLRSSDHRYYYKRLLKIPNGTSKVVGRDDGVERVFTYNVELSPVTRVELDKTSLAAKDFKVIDKNTSLPISFKKNLSYLYFKSKIGYEIEIMGITANNVVVTEQFSFDSSILKRSRYTYKRLLRVTSNYPDYVIYNYIDCSEYHSAEIFESLPITYSEAKRPNYNVFRIVGDTLCEEEDSVERSYKRSITNYTFRSDLKEAYVNEYGNVLAVNKNKDLVATVLAKNFNTSFKLIENNNNNPYVFLEDFDLETKDAVFLISTRDIISDLEIYAIDIEIKTEKGVFFLNESGEFSKDASEILISKTNSIDLIVNLKDTSYVSVTVSAGLKKYQSSYVDNTLQCKTLQTDIDGLFVNGSSNYVIKGGDVYLLDLKKDYYETDLEGTLISLSGDVKFINSKGDDVDDRF